MKDLEGKMAVVTGAASGIGLALARRFAAARMKVVLADIEAAPLAAAAEELSATGAQILAVRTDVCDAEQVAALADETERAFGPVHVLCNNAGVGGGGGALWAVSEADWKWTLDVNLWGVIHGIRAFVPRMLAHGEAGHVVNTASMAGLTATPSLGPYTVAKFGVVALSEVLAKDLDLAGAKLKVSVLCPAFVKTRIAESHRNRPAVPASARGEVPGAGQMASAIRAMVEQGIAPEDVAEQVLAAIHDERFYILTHPETKPAVAVRMKDVLEDRSPKIDPTLRALLSGDPHRDR
jgi:NAD(P)-dependent dehydrogenase (short-subunit alcohol dehydrogenase family)